MKDAYFTYDELIRLTDDLNRQLPEVDLIVGIARSGLIPAAKIACDRHLTLVAWSARRGFMDVGSGPRLQPQPGQRIALVDDGVSSGRQMMGAAAQLKANGCKDHVTAAVIRHVDGGYVPDHYSVGVEGHCIFEWTWPNSPMLETYALDFDGILCENLPPDLCDGGESEAKAMVCAAPLFMPRRSSIPLVVTARQEKHRPETEAWLDRYGISAQRLVMRDWLFEPGCDRDRVTGEWKASIFRESGLAMFVESEIGQATVIAKRSGKPVLCPSSRRIIVP